MGRNLTLGTLLLLLGWMPAQSQTGYYPFSIDQDRLHGAPDFSHLNQPLGPADRLFVREGAFHKVGPDRTPHTSDDERVRLFGMNLSFSANFPAEADAPRIARRLRRMGVNLVRLHHLDTQPDSIPANANSLLTTEAYPTLNPVALQRLRVFLAALRGEGIYVNLNLKVGYQFRPWLDRLPAHSSFPSQSKPLHIFYPRMVELQREFTVKSIQGLGLGEDPVLGMVEINNESSLLREWQTGNLDRTLEGEYGVELRRQWNEFLRGKYSSGQELRAAWTGGETDGRDLLTMPWRLEKGAPSDGVFEEVSLDEEPAVRLTVTSQGPRLILKKVGFSIEEGEPYIAEVEMRLEAAGQSRPIYWDVKQDVSPWRTLAGRTVTVTSQWQTFRMAFVATFPMDGIGRFGLAVERLDVPLSVRRATVFRAGKRGLAEGEGLEYGNVALVAETEMAVEQRMNDYLLFLEDRDRYYLSEMHSAVRQTAGGLVPVAGTQMGYGGLLNLDSHEGLDYQDNHFYIDHYNFPNVAWDSRDWRIRDSSAVDSGLSSFLNMAASREAGRPFTVSEYNQNWPNTHAAEIGPSLAVFGAFQDWDSIMHFAYSHNRLWDDPVPKGFDMNGDLTKFPSVGQTAWLFRSGAIAAGRNPVDIPVSKADRLRATREKRNGAIATFLTALAGYEPTVALRHPVRLAKDAAGELTEAAKTKPEAVVRADTGEFSLDRERRLFLVHAPQAAGVFGAVRGEKVTAGAADVELGRSARGFAAILLTSLDNTPLEESRRLLLTTPGAAFRTHPGTAPARPQRLVHYPGTTDWWTVEPEPEFAHRPSGNRSGGAAPVWLERVECFLTLRTTAGRVSVHPLGQTGERLDALAGHFIERVNGGFRIHLQAEGQVFSPWYELVLE